VPLYSEPSEKSSIVARAELGVIAHLPFCQNRWCELEVNGYEGWVLRQNIWGTYPGENFE
jgi:SH3-like domain-containing protein